MSAHLLALCFDAHDPEALGRFWSGVLGWQPADHPAGSLTLLPDDDTAFQLRFLPSREPKRGQNHIHFDLTSSSLENQQRTVDRALRLGASHLDIGQGPEASHVVLADPEGNELCVIAPGNSFLADCGLLGALSCDGSQQVGYFWSAALGWPLVWDQDQETAIRSPAGGPKISWGGPPLLPRTGRSRLHLDLGAADGDVDAEVERLLALGATRTKTLHDSHVALVDPDGREFCLLARP
jgi:predicted enzyme related to lactoylglutathione lyase